MTILADQEKQTHKEPWCSRRHGSMVWKDSSSKAGVGACSEEQDFMDDIHQLWEMACFGTLMD